MLSPLTSVGSKRGIDYALAVLLFLAALASSALQITVFETAGDAISYWTAADRLLQADLPEWYLGGDADRRITRLSVVVPAMLIKMWTANHPLGFHVGPMIMFALSVAALYLAGTRLSSRAVGICAASLLLIFPSTVRNSVQLLPGSFEAAYLLLSVLGLVFYTEKYRKRHLILSALGLFLDYSAKFTAVFAAPAIFLVLISYRTPIKHLLLFIGVMGFCYLLEALVLSSFGYPYGRLEFLFAHREPMNHKFMIVTSLAEFFSRWSGTHVGRFWVHLRDYLIVATVICAFVKNRPIRILACILITHALITTFAIRSSDPVRLLTNPQMRYLTIYAPVAILFVCLSGYSVIRKVVDRIARKGDAEKWRKYIGKQSHIVICFVLFLFHGRLFYEWGPVYFENIGHHRALLASHKHGIQNAVRYRNLLRRSYERGTPILVEWFPESPGNTINKTRGISAIYLRELGERPVIWKKDVFVEETQYWLQLNNKFGLQAGEESFAKADDATSVIAVTNSYAPNGVSSNWREVHPQLLNLSELRWTND